MRAESRGAAHHECEHNDDGGGEQSVGDDEDCRCHGWLPSSGVADRFSVASHGESPLRQAWETSESLARAQSWANTLRSDSVIGGAQQLRAGSVRARFERQAQTEADVGAPDGARSTAARTSGATSVPNSSIELSTSR
jgi:hypothetical protein